jgi:hypothetical protein
VAAKTISAFNLNVYTPTNLKLVIERHSFIQIKLICNNLKKKLHEEFRRLYNFKLFHHNVQAKLTCNINYKINVNVLLLQDRTRNICNLQHKEKWDVQCS